MQKYNSDLIRYIENIRFGRDDLHDEIVKDEDEKREIESEIAQLSERLSNLTDALMKKYEARDDFDRTILETEQAFMRILESSQTLLHVLKKEDQQLSKKKNNVTTKKVKGVEITLQQSPEKKVNITKNSKSHHHNHQPLDQSVEYSYD